MPKIPAQSGGRRIDFCAACGKEIDWGDASCPYCQAVQTRAEPAPRSLGRSWRRWDAR